MTAGAGPAVTAVVLAAAVLHATWSALAHRIPDTLVAFTWLGLGYVAVCGPAVLVLPVPSRAAWPFLAASVAVHAAYMLLMMHSYRLGEFNQVYPLARGTAPLVVAFAAALLVDEPLTAAGAVGVLAVSAGLASLVLAGGLPGGRHRTAVAAAVATGLAIAVYTVVDGIGVRRSGSAFGYAAWLLLLQGPIVPLYALWRRGPGVLGSHGVLGTSNDSGTSDDSGSGERPRPHRYAGLAAGALSVLAYALVLWAQSRGALAAVAALRETSVVAGAVIGSVWFGERFGRARVLATVLVSAGVVLLNLP